MDDNKQLQQRLLPSDEPVLYSGSKPKNKKKKISSTTNENKYNIELSSIPAARPGYFPEDLTEDLDAKRNALIRRTIKREMKAFKAELEKLGIEYPVFKEISDDIQWKKIESALIKEHIQKGKYWEKGTPYQKEMIATMTSFGTASQCDEGLFAILNTITAVQGLKAVLGDNKIITPLFWLVTSLLSFYGAYPDIYGINPAKQAKNGIQPEFEFKITRFTSEEHAKFYRHATLLNKRLNETSMKPWKKIVGTATLGVASAVSAYSLGQYLLQDEFNSLNFAPWPMVGSAVLTGSTIAGLTYSGLGLKALQLFSDPFNWISFSFTNLAGAIAQYIPIAELYGTHFGDDNEPNNFSRWLKMIFGITFWAIVYKAALHKSEMRPYKKYGLAMLWFALCVSLILEKPSVELTQMLSVAWTLGFFAPVGISYYEFLSRSASNFWGEHFWTLKNTILQLFQVSPWLGIENLLQLLTNCGRRSAAFSGIVAQYLLLGYALDTCPPWVMWLTVGLTFVSSVFTRMAGLPILSTFQVKDPFGRIITVPSTELLNFKVNGQSAFSQAELRTSQKALQLLFTAVYSGLLAAGAGLLTTPSFKPWQSVGVGTLAWGGFGAINYFGQNLSVRSENARSLINKNILLLTPKEIKKAEKEERLKKGGTRFAVTTLISNSLMRILSSAFMIAGFGLLYADAGLGLGSFTTVWLAALCLATAPAFNEARVTLNAEALPSAIALIEESEKVLVDARDNPQPNLNPISYCLHKGFYGLFGSQLPAANELDDEEEEKKQIQETGRETPAPQRKSRLERLIGRLTSERNEILRFMEEKGTHTAIEDTLAAKNREIQVYQSAVNLLDSSIVATDSPLRAASQSSVPSSSNSLETARLS